MVAYCFEPARSGRSKCGTCLSSIANRSLRLMEIHYQNIHFHHARCTPPKAMKWLAKRWPGEGEILTAHAALLTTVQLEELKVVQEKINAAAGAKKIKRRGKRPSKKQQDTARAELEKTYPVGRKGIVSVRRDSGPFAHEVTNFFVKVTRCTPRLVELREYENGSEVRYQDDRILISRVRADWDRPRVDSVLGEYHRVERHRMTGTFGAERQCKPFEGKVQTCYLFEGDFSNRDDDGATTIDTSIASAGLDPSVGDAVHVRSISGTLLLRMSEGKARDSFVKDLIREIEDRVGLAVRVQVLAAKRLLKALDPLSPLMTEGDCLTLTAIFKSKPVIVDEEGRAYPHLVDLLDSRPMHPAVKSIDEAYDIDAASDREPWLG